MNQTVRAVHPSWVVLPQQQTDKPTVLAFLLARFPAISETTWRQRLQQGKVHWQDGERINELTPYRPAQRVYYYREVASEPHIPFQEQILYQDSQSLLVFKPHFLPVTPGGHFVNECLVARLRARTGIDTIVPVHRLDRDTAGVMLLSVSAASRDAYHGLFRNGQIHKRYQALARLTPAIQQQLPQGWLSTPRCWTVKNRIERGQPGFTMRIVDGVPNSHSEIRLLAVKADIGLFELQPITGKTHQLRLHMLSLGMPLLNDRYYPELQPLQADDFSRPLKLVACELSYRDPLNGELRHIDCEGLAAELALDS
ncbi:pseudouridine synthase [Shewanella dokdonensis]|uniref:Pseudouridine synthase n=1 Tax=Shewanella dokdonensis TaxID=712036 RepID=A0ABX8DB73_9GAMM|nr:pseudouridine synthase [Shewanella dokdonensis]MCL1075371.1 pseudouridine synthase [Shewanella dokdonensis]QVK22075.1 pseudouridine synthase [Shewanella dokdonensis]